MARYDLPTYVLHVLGHFWMFAVKIAEWLFSLKSLGLWTHLPIVWDKVPNKFGFFLTPSLMHVVYGVKRTTEISPQSQHREKKWNLHKFSKNKKRQKKVHLEVVHVAPKEDLWQLKWLKLVLVWKNISNATIIQNNRIIVYMMMVYCMFKTIGWC